ncbi:hypothetical protein [Achromobacter kerstersii]|uniref:Uncharacterized protein n=1 Tax=Achromobacter kerstersii TaxID=1353890 RepID=A0A6S6ZHE2_9BURK|nr:hypothetical protein [Achromobacter kerstersii]CAB3680346.1 hypothetical protein LMG3441_01557 [Achromobacter kerstersii]
MESNGILAQVPGQFTAQASQTLPPAATADDRDYDVVIEARHLGTVRITFRKHKAKRAKHSHWFWLAQRAERV